MGFRLVRDVTRHERQRLTTTVMTPGVALELSIEQLIDALNKKLFMECARVHSVMPPMSRSLVATLSAEVRRRSHELKGPQVLTIYFTGRCSRGTSQRRFT